jgi:hypothetical protein
LSEWCPSCGSESGEHVLTKYRDRDIDVCVVCGQEAAGGHALCPLHQAETESMLRTYAPALLAYLEQSADSEVDAYIAHGRLKNPRWWVGADIRDAARSLGESLFDLYASEDLDARMLYGSRPPSDPSDPRPYLSMSGLDAPSWFLDHAAPILERAIREVFSTLPTEPLERNVISRAAAGPEDAAEIGTPYEMVFGYLDTSEPPLSEDAQDLVSARYHHSGIRWFWFGWDCPDRVWLASGILPPELQERLRLVEGRWA